MGTGCRVAAQKKQRMKELPMDAREYLARKGLDGSRDEARPNSLEEKAWERARQSDQQQPRAGTPHDWEDWERYHQVLAEGASVIEQKFDREAQHQRDAAHEPSRQSANATVQEYIPPGETGTDTNKTSITITTPASRIDYGALAVLVSPAAGRLAGGGSRRVCVRVRCVT